MPYYKKLVNSLIPSLLLQSNEYDDNERKSETKSMATKTTLSKMN